MSFDSDDPKWTAYALGELSDAERAEVERELESDPQAQAVVAEIRGVAGRLGDELRAEPLPALAAVAAGSAAETRQVERRRQKRVSRFRVGLIAATVLIGLIASFTLPAVNNPREYSRKAARLNEERQARLEAKTSGERLRVAPAPASQPADLHSLENKLTSESLSRSGGDRSRVYQLEVDRKEKLAAGGRFAGLQSSVGQAAGPTPVTGHTGLTLGRRFESSPQPQDRDNFYREQEQVRHNTEAYDHLVDNAFLTTADNPLSTFSIDVDTASYSNVRRFLLQQNQLPPHGAVRIEELINYFRYDYPQPEGGEPFSATTEVAACPWQPEHRLVRIGLKGREIPKDKRPASNLVFLIDVSGSMSPANKLPLVQQSLKMLTEQLTANDRVAIVVYAGSSGLVLPSTQGDDRDAILTAIERLQAGGSTNGAQGIELAYDIAAGNLIKGGVNRVILSTDGDFNVGITDQDALIRLIEEKAKSGVFFTALGFGYGNIKDSTLEKLVDKGNGNYAYIDTPREAQKVLVEQIGGTLVTIAKDVKIQIEFNPAAVASYRLIGYENRLLAKEDFNDDTKDGGEIGAGHSVTALYEIVPTSEGAAPASGVSKPAEAAVDPLKYQRPGSLSDAATSGEFLTFKLRYKQPDGDKSTLMQTAVTDSAKKFAEATADFKFVASVAAFGMILRDSPHKGNATLSAVEELAREGVGADEGGYRAEFLQLIAKAKGLKGP